MHEEKLLDMTNKLEFQKGNENMIQNEIINLKQENEMSNKTIINLQEEIKANYILIPELQNKVDVSEKLMFIIITLLKINNCVVFLITFKIYIFRI